MDSKHYYLQVVGGTPALSEQTRRLLLNKVDELPSDVQHSIAKTLSMFERRLVAALESYALHEESASTEVQR